MFSFRLRPAAPFDFSRMLDRLRGVPHELYRLEQGALVRTIRVRERVFLVRLDAAGTTDVPEIIVTLAEDPSEMELTELRGRLETMMSAHTDLSACYAHLRRFADLSPLVDRLYGLRLLLEADLFECMIKTIVGQQLNLAFAATLNRRLIERAGDTYKSADGMIYPVFPTPGQVAKLQVEELRAMQFSQRKAEYVLDFASRVVSGELELATLRHLSNEEIVERLVRMRGIGRWTVECFLMFGLGRTDLLPAADIGLRNALKRLHRLAERPTEAEVRQIGAAWSPWSSYATYYLWESLKATEHSKELHPENGSISAILSSIRPNT